MRAPVVHHPAYVTPLPAAHRFPMPKFAPAAGLLRETGLLAADAGIRAGAGAARLARARPWQRPMWLASSSSGSMRRRSRRLGLPLSPVLALRSRCAVAGTVLAARLALEHGIACNTAGGSHHAFAGAGAGFCVFNDVAVAARLLLAEGMVAPGRWSSTSTCTRATAPPAILADEPRVFTLLDPLPGATSRRASSRATSTSRSMPDDRRRGLSAPRSPAAAGAARSRAARPRLLQCRRRSARGRPARAAWRSPTPAWRSANGWCSSRAGAAALPLACVVGGGYAPTTWMSSPAGTRCCTRRSRTLPAW